MADDAQPKKGQRSRKAVKVGVRRGGGRSPGYEWNVDVFDFAHQEAAAFLTDEQHAQIGRAHV